MILMKKLTTKEFIKRCKEKHGDKYCYVLTKYNNMHTKITIICPIHGIFEQKAQDHSLGYGCTFCSGTNLKSNEDFIKDAQKIHGVKYKYHNVDYKGNKTKIIITCRIHGDFEQLPADHLKGSGCPWCKNVAKKDTDMFIHQVSVVHKNKYRYNNAFYINAHTKLLVTCEKHGLFAITPCNHLNGTGCPICHPGGFRTDKKGFLYLLRSEDGLFVKVGVTNNIKNRIKTLIKKTPFRFSLVECYKNNGNVVLFLEKCFIDCYDTAGFQGFDGATEWLHFNDQILENFRVLTNKSPQIHT